MIFLYWSNYNSLLFKLQMDHHFPRSWVILGAQNRTLMESLAINQLKVANNIYNRQSHAYICLITRIYV